MNINEVYQLMDKFEGSSLSELSFEMDGVKLSVKKACADATASAASMSASESIKTAGTSEMTDPIKVTDTAETAGTVETKTINAPLVGTFYRAAGPGEHPFVEVGQQVKKGDVVAIIEAMKLMNEITAAEDGIVEEIVAEDGSLVEYNQVLIRMK